jgi:antitoxin component YwqK of YwqJK toxin-antitoxin module
MYNPSADCVASEVSNLYATPFEFLSSSQEKIAYLQSLTEPQKMLFAYYHLLQNVGYYGSHRYFWEGNVIYSKIVKKACVFFKNQEALELYSQAEAIYWENKMVYDAAETDDDESLLKIENIYFESPGNIIVVEYIRQNADFFCFDDNGKPFAYGEKGICKVPYSGEEISYYQNRREGESKSYYPNGQLLSIMNYKNGQLEGNLSSGNITRFYENGQIPEQHTASQENGDLKETLTWFYENGQIKQTYSRINNVVQGEVLRFDKQGQALSMEVIF